MKNQLNRLPLIALAALPLTVGLVFAQQGNAGTGATTASDTTAQAPQRVQPAQPGQRNQQGQNGQGQTQQGQTQQGQPGERPQRSGTNYADAFIKNLAAQLNTTPEKLKAAATKAGAATIDAAVKAGDIPADRAADMKTRLAENPFAFGGGRGPGGRGDHGPRDGNGARDGQRGPRGQQPGAPAGSADQGSTEQGGAAADSTSGT
ncbi:hypothetical protein [Deinococcus knuensis]|uniref:Translation initiation factor IF-2 n=1 Tax=Deinococcus knuensis TaxID=1837380 RepID=A0ABQ2SG41_9DEIO|nr:hypothetical protein [Deinococcus knuensis]GGS24277.1 hypothetical protein GCM10008961_14820 [Deinococcus knuensis]